MNWTPFLRQLFLCSGCWTLCFLEGLCIGFPTVLAPQLNKSNQTLSSEQFSWLVTINTYCGIPWVIIISGLIVVIGRKMSQIIVCVTTLLGFIIFYFSTNINIFFIGMVVQGALFCSHLTTNVAILTEFTSSEYRGIFLTLKSVTSFWGVLAANAIGTFFHWRNIIVLGLVCSVYTLLNIIIWPESPLWLATKGRLAECSAAHRWLKGDDEKSEKELEILLKSHQCGKFVQQQRSIRYLVETICRKQFLKPILLSYILICTVCFSGKLICTVYVLKILKKISNSENAAFSGMLILDGVTVASMYLGSLLSKFFKRRVILLGFSTCSITFMTCISIYLYLAKLLVIQENNYISLFLLAGYSVCVSCGPMTMSMTIIAELLPLDSRILSLCMIGIIFKITNGTFLKMSPYTFKNLDVHGTFALYAVLSAIFLILIYFYVPETKNKTIQEIDNCMKYGEKIEARENKELMSLKL